MNIPSLGPVAGSDRTSPTASAAPNAPPESTRRSTARLVDRPPQLGNPPARRRSESSAESVETPLIETEPPAPPEQPPAAKRPRLSDPGESLTTASKEAVALAPQADQAAGAYLLDPGMWSAVGAYLTRDEAIAMRQVNKAAAPSLSIGLKLRQSSVSVGLEARTCAPRASIWL